MNKPATNNNVVVGRWLGDIVRERVVGAATIKQRVSRVAYARNGNALNPTLTYAFDVYVAGKLVVICHTLRAAKLAAAEASK